MASEALGVVARAGRVDVETQLGQLDADLRWAGPSAGLVEQGVIVSGHRVGAQGTGEVLAEMGEEDADPFSEQPIRRCQRIVDRLSRHEAAHRPTSEGQARQMVAQPRVAGHPEQQPAHRPMVPRVP